VLLKLIFSLTILFFNGKVIDVAEKEKKIVKFI